MGSKTGLIIGIGIGFVLGARAGRERYDQIKQLVYRLRQTPIVARPVDAAADKVADAIRSTGEQLSDAVAESVKSKVFGVRDAEIVVVENRGDQPLHLQ